MDFRKTKEISFGYLLNLVLEQSYSLIRGDYGILLKNYLCLCFDCQFINYQLNLIAKYSDFKHLCFMESFIKLSFHQFWVIFEQIFVYLLNYFNIKYLVINLILEFITLSFYLVLFPFSEEVIYLDYIFFQNF